MLHLAFDTSTDRLSVALSSDGRVHARHEAVGQRHAELILPTVLALLAEASRKLEEVEAIAFGAGPGAFTGLRIACGVAQGLGLSLRCPLVAVDSFEAIASEAASEAGAEAADAARDGALHVMVAIDARMGEVYAAEMAFRDGDWHRVDEPQVVKAESVRLPRSKRVIGAGTGFAAYGDALRERLGIEPSSIHPAITPRASVMLGRIERALSRGATVDPEDAAPIYLRDQVALTIAERAAERERAASAARSAP